MTKLYLATESLTESILDYLIEGLTLGLGKHYFLILENKYQRIRMCFGPDGIRLRKTNVIGHYLGSTRKSIKQIVHEIKLKWAKKRYDIYQNNCIQFIRQVCNHCEILCDPLSTTPINIAAIFLLSLII